MELTFLVSQDGTNAKRGHVRRACNSCRHKKVSHSEMAFQQRKLYADFARNAAITISLRVNWLLGILPPTSLVSQVAKVLHLRLQDGIQQSEIDLHLQEASD